MESKQFDDKFRQLSKKESAGNIDFNDLDTEANSLAAQAHKKAGTIVKDKGKKASTAKLDNYNVLQNIGEGAYGSVNLAYDKTTGKKVAIKAVNIMKICELNKDRHILREKDLLNTLNHFNIIRLFSTFKVSSFNFFHISIG